MTKVGKMKKYKNIVYLSFSSPNNKFQTTDTLKYTFNKMFKVMEV